MKFVWTKDYIIGIQSIDKEHKKFFALANKIVRLIKKREILLEEFIELLSELEVHAVYHCDNEEGYFDRFGYEDAEKHIAEHQEFRRKVESYYDRAKESNDLTELAREVAGDSIHWLHNHIFTMDKLYTKFFLEHGVE